MTQIAHTQEELEAKIDRLKPEDGDLIIVTYSSDAHPQQIDHISKHLTKIKEALEPKKVVFFIVSEMLKVEMLPGAKKVAELEKRIEELEYELGAVETQVNDLEGQVK